MAMNRVTVTKKYFDTDTSRKVENTEFMQFWKSLTDEEKTDYSNAAAQQLGEEVSA